MMEGNSLFGAAQPSALTLSQFQLILGNTIRTNPDLQNAWVMAELSDVRLAGGHCYMELIEKDERSGQMRAKMRAVIWQSSYCLIREKFRNATQSEIQSGIKVMVKGSVTHHAVFGLSFNITDINPDHTLGEMERQRREILALLQREGIIDLNKQRELPLVPQKIAVISAAGAAGYGDFMEHLTNTPEGFRFYPFLIPAVMQGERTTASVSSALDFVESTIDVWDCVVIIRGGGSTTDLNGFDTYELAERVARFGLPVIVGIGHERDRTVLDEIARVRCKTPTAVADFLTDRCRRVWTETENRARKIAQYAADRLGGENMRLGNIENLLPAKIKTGLLKGEKRVSETAHAVERAAERKMTNASRRMEMATLRLGNALKGATEKPAMRIKNIEDMLRVLSPENTLKRGYSITRVNGHAVYDASSLKEGDRIATNFYRGEAVSTVEEIRINQES